MKGKLKKIDDKWVVEYSTSSYSGGNPKQLGSYTKKVEQKTLPLLMDSTTFPKDRSNFVIGSRVKFTEVLVNPMGREVDPNNLGQNHSECVWYAKLIYDEDGVKEEQKQHLIDIMKSDEELGLYEQIDQNNPVTKGSTALVKEIKLEDVFNDKKREGVKKVIHQHKVLKDLSLVNPSHLEMTSDGHGEFPDGYKLTEKGIQYIIEQLNKE
jgi:hypothetical protein